MAGRGRGWDSEMREGDGRWKHSKYWLAIALRSFLTPKPMPQPTPSALNPTTLELPQTGSSPQPSTLRAKSVYEREKAPVPG